MPAWVHDRAQHLLAKNPKMDKSQAFAIATQQSHALGKSPKGYGTSEGKSRAKQKFNKPKKQYVKGANPGGLKTPKLEAREKKAMDSLVMTAMRDELLEIEKNAQKRGIVRGLLNRLGVSTSSLGHAAGDAKRTSFLGKGMDKRMARGEFFGGAPTDVVRHAHRAQAPVRPARLAPVQRPSPKPSPSGLDLDTSGQWLSKISSALRRKQAYAALTPAGRLRRAQSVGRAPGAMETSTPSLSDQVKPKGSGFGQSLPGANQGGKS